MADWFVIRTWRCMHTVCVHIWTVSCLLLPFWRGIIGLWWSCKIWLKIFDALLYCCLFLLFSIKSTILQIANFLMYKLAWTIYSMYAFVLNPPVSAVRFSPIPRSRHIKPWTESIFSAVETKIVLSSLSSSYMEIFLFEASNPLNDSGNVKSIDYVSVNRLSSQPFQMIPYRLILFQCTFLISNFVMLKCSKVKYCNKFCFNRQCYQRISMQLMERRKGLLLEASKEVKMHIADSVLNRKYREILK